MSAICDTGPLVAYLVRTDPQHAWALATIGQTRAPMLVCEPVLTEAAYFLRQFGLSTEPMFQLLERTVIQVDFEIAFHWRRMRTLMARYPQMDFADAAVVVMTELHRRCQVLTLDRKDFSTYRRNDRQVIPFRAPNPPK